MNRARRRRSARRICAETLQQCTCLDTDRGQLLVQLGEGQLVPRQIDPVMLRRLVWLKRRSGTDRHPRAATSPLRAPARHLDCCLPRHAHW